MTDSYVTLCHTVVTLCHTKTNMTTYTPTGYISSVTLGLKNYITPKLSHCHPERQKCYGGR